MTPVAFMRGINDHIGELWDKRAVKDHDLNVAEIRLLRHEVNIIFGDAFEEAPDKEPL